MESYILTYSRESLYLVLILAGPPIIMAMVVGLIVSLFQATTQIQEQTLTFVPKMFTVVLVLIILGPLGMAKLISFTRVLFENFPDVIR